MTAKPGTYSAIRKVALEGPVQLTAEGIEGDQQVHLKYHGGPFKALCFYASEYYPAWNAHTVEAMPGGSFGENVHTAGLHDHEVCLGDRFRIGRALIEVSGPRGPCNNLSAHWGVKELHLWCKRARQTGFYARVVEAGAAEAGSRITLEDRPLPRATLPVFWDLLDGKIVDPLLVRVMLQSPALDPANVPQLSRLVKDSDQ